MPPGSLTSVDVYVTMSTGPRVVLREAWFHKLLDKANQHGSTPPSQQQREWCACAGVLRSAGIVHSAWIGGVPACRRIQAADVTCVELHHCVHAPSAARARLPPAGNPPAKTAGGALQPAPGGTSLLRRLLGALPLQYNRQLGLVSLPGPRSEATTVRQTWELLQGADSTPLAVSSR